MRLSTSVQYTAGVLAVALVLAGCTSNGASQAIPGASQADTAVQAGLRAPRHVGRAGASPLALAALKKHHGRSWMDATTKKTNLLYLSTYGTSSMIINVYAYRRDKLKGQLTGFGQELGGLCSSKKGNVYIVDPQNAVIVEYAHGGTTPIATLGDPGNIPLGCAVDPKTGDVAVTNNNGNLAIYNSQGVLSHSLTDDVIVQPWFCGYDKDGNLFMDGHPLSGSGFATGFALAELPAGTTTFTDITGPTGPYGGPAIGFPGGVQWDGKYLAVSDQEGPIVDQLQITGTTATIVNTIDFDAGSSGSITQFWVPKLGNGKVNPQGTMIVVPDAGDGVANLYRYPAGGAVVRAYSDVGGSFGATVSRGKVAASQ